MHNLKPVNNHPELVRDENTNVILNRSEFAYKLRLQQIEASSKKKLEVDSLLSEICAIKSDIASIKSTIREFKLILNGIVDDYK
jgi:hypothetical protein